MWLFVYWPFSHHYQHLCRYFLVRSYLLIILIKLIIHQDRINWFQGFWPRIPWSWPMEMDLRDASTSKNCNALMGINISRNGGWGEFYHKFPLQKLPAMWINLFSFLDHFVSGLPLPLAPVRWNAAQNCIKFTTAFVHNLAAAIFCAHYEITPDSRALGAGPVNNESEPKNPTTLTLLIICPTQFTKFLLFCFKYFICCLRLHLP